jgi:peptidyl-prolyl cis-trans isomerase C
MKLGVLLAIAGVFFISSHSIAETKNNSVVRIGDQVITEQQFQLVYQLISHQSGQVADKKVVLEELVNAMLLAQEAQRQLLHEEPKIKEAITQQRNALLSSAMRLKLSEDLQPSSAEMQAETKVMPTEEYRLGYILVAEEALAKRIIAELNNTASFAPLAKKYSIDSSRDAGGDVGWSNDWLTSKTLVPVINSLKIGQHTQQPNKGNEGWQIIQLKDKRPISPVASQQLLQQIKVQLTEEKIKHYIANIKAKTTIIYP